MIVTAAQAGIV